MQHLKLNLHFWIQLLHGTIVDIFVYGHWVFLFLSAHPLLPPAFHKTINLKL